MPGTERESQIGSQLGHSALRTFLSNFGHIPIRQYRQVGLHARVLDTLAISLLIVGLAEQNILSKGGILNPCILGAKGNGVAKGDVAAQPSHLTNLNNAVSL